jgi:hypothetical protein
MASIRLLPRSLVARVYALYLAALLIFVGTGLGLFFSYQFGQVIEDAQQSATMLVEVAAQTVTESAVIGDYDTIKRTLDKAILRSPFASATFIDLQGGVLHSNNEAAVVSNPPPGWLLQLVAGQLYDINRNITAGGTDYGVLRLVFATDLTAERFWHLIQVALGLAVGGLVLGLMLIWFPLRRWLGTLDRVHAFERDFLHKGDYANAALAADLPVEFQGAFAVLQRTADSLRKELEQRKQALSSLRVHRVRRGGGQRQPRHPRRWPAAVAPDRARHWHWYCA